MMISFEPFIRLIFVLMAVLMVLCGSVFLAVVYRGVPSIARAVQLGLLGTMFVLVLIVFVLLIRALR